jgi:putative flippase GtrA
MDAFRVHRWRLIRFVLVGGFCFGVQYAIMTVLGRAGVDLSLANAVGFVVSAQVNFGLSALFTWRGAAGVSWLGWASYNSTAVLGLAMNVAVFGVVHRTFGAFLGAAAGVGAGAVFTYVVCNFLIFRSRRAPVAEAEIAA